MRLILFVFSIGVATRTDINDEFSEIDEGNLTWGSKGSILCRCEYSSTRLGGDAAFGDCVRFQKTTCFNKNDLRKALQSSANKLKLPKLSENEVSCRAITIDGKDMPSAKQATFIQTDRELPQGVSYCDPRYDKDDLISPLSALTKFSAELEDDGAASAPQNAISAGQPDSLFSDCMYCGSKSNGPTTCCGGSSRYTGKPLPKQCRLYTEVVDGSDTFTPVPELVINKLSEEGKDPGEACCGGEAVFSRNGEWQCRENIAVNEYIWMMENGPTNYKKWAFSHCMMEIYSNHFHPIESASMYERFDAQPLTLGQINSLPTVFLVGTYSSGKTTFIQHVLGEAYPGGQIGVEPTTDKFVVIQHGEESQVIPGFTMSSDASNGFSEIGNSLGSSFQRHFAGAKMPSEVLKDIQFIDSPGILSGKAQQDRGYDFERVVDFFAERSDVVLLFFDVFKLDVGEEFGRIVKTLIKRGRHRKVRVVLNKADMIGPDKLLRVHGGLMWYLSQIMGTPEAVRVYIGNFGGFEYQHTELSEFFDKEYTVLMNGVLVESVEKAAVTRKVDNLIERAQRLKGHAILMDKLREKCRGNRKNQLDCIDNLPEFINDLAKTWNMKSDDFPDESELQYQIRKDEKVDLSKLERMDKDAVTHLNYVLNADLPRLVTAMKKTYASDPDGQQDALTFGAAP